MKHPAVRILLGIIALLLVVVIAYVAYVFIDYHRIEDNQPVAITHQADAASAVQPGVTYTALTYNIGFGAYTPDFSFFMDGGVSSWASSEESVRRCTLGAIDIVKRYSPDFVCLEEVDRNSTRSYHVDQKALLDAEMPGYDDMFAVNYDSPFLFYPFTQPHGKSYSGLVLYSRYPMQNGVRRSLPITTDVTKLVDLDRCYMKARVPMTDGRELVFYTIHMTAYTSDATVRDAQLAMLKADMLAEYAAGNAAICGGDYNMEMLKSENSPATALWAKPLERSALGELVNVWDAIPDADKAAQPGSCRDSGVAYQPGVTEEWVVDSFIVTPNVTVEAVNGIDAGYQYSDHNPVLLTFHIN